MEISTRYVHEGVPFVNRRYTKGVPFPVKKVYKRVRGWTSGWSLPYKTSPGMILNGTVTCADVRLWQFSIVVQ